MHDFQSTTCSVTRLENTKVKTDFQAIRVHCEAKALFNDLVSTNAFYYV